MVQSEKALPRQKLSFPRPTTVVVVWLAVGGLSVAALAQYGGGTGDPNDPFLIYTAEQMNAIGTRPNDWDKHFQLRADIDLSVYLGDSFNRIGYDYRPQEPSGWLPPFSGVFDGNDHTIAHFTCIVDPCESLPPRNWWGDENVGLFGYVRGPEALIKNLGLIDPNIAPAPTCSERVVHVGALVGELAEGTIADCYVDGGSVVADRYLGGLVGTNRGHIARCYTSCTVSRAPDRTLRSLPEEYAFLAEPGYVIGGLVGSNQGQISHCHSSATVEGGGSVGGLVGQNSANDEQSGIITDSRASGTVSGNDDIGGLVGHSTGTIQSCYASGLVSGDKSVGGLVGYSVGLFQPAIITSCHATGGVLGNKYLGGLVGGNHGTIQDSFATGWVSGTDLVGGLTGFNYGTVYACCATGAVTGNGQSAGGLSGTNPGDIIWCYARGGVTGDMNAGGLVGFSSGAVHGSYAAGPVAGASRIGGLIGTGSGTATDSFWDVEASGWSSSAGGTGKSTMAMMFAGTYTDAGWDFAGETAYGTDDVWQMCSGRPTYPYLAWQQRPAGDFVDPDGIDGRDLSFMAQHWLVSTDLPCYGADLTFDGKVDLHDLAVLGLYWRHGEADEVFAPIP